MANYINKSILRNRIASKFRDQMFHAIVNECFVNALPLNKGDITREERKSLYHYSRKVLDTLGGFNALESAIDIDHKSFAQNLFIGEIYNICNESANMAAKKNDYEKKSKDKSLDEIVDKTSLSDDEIRSFSKKAESLKIDKISDVIRDKTLAVIKDEQEQYEKEIELDGELKDALASSDKSEDVSTESYINIYLDKTAPRHHITVFSRLQEAAMEMMDIMHTGDDIFPIVEKTTLEAFFPEYKISSKLACATEATNTVSNEELCDVPAGNKPKYATLISIIVYTMMETLKTMNIFCPTSANIKKFVDKPVNPHMIANEDKKISLEKAERIVRESNLIDFSKAPHAKLSSKLVELKEVAEMAEECLMHDPTSERAIRVMSSAVDLTNSIEEVLFKRDNMLQDTSVTESYYTSLSKSKDVAEFNKINQAFGKKPNVAEIRFHLDPNGSSIIAVECVNSMGQKVGNSFVNISYACESSQLIPYLKETYKESKLTTSGKNSCLIIDDGKSTKISL